MHYILDEIAAASEDLDYGYTEDNQQLWLDTDFCQQTDWTDLYFRGITTYYRSHSVYQTILERKKRKTKPKERTEEEKKVIKAAKLKLMDDNGFDEQGALKFRINSFSTILILSLY